MVNLSLIVLYFIVSLLFIYITGSFVLIVFKIKTINLFTDLFIKYFMGLVSVVSIFSIYTTKGRSIYSVFLLIVVLILLKSYNHAPIQAQNIEKKSKYETSDYLLLFTFIAISLSFQFMNYFNNGQFLLPVLDEIFYSRLSVKILSGTESYYTATDFGYFLNQTSPYHYFEIWMDSFFSSAFGINVFISRLFISTPILFFVLFIGFTAIIETIEIKQKWLAIVFVFFGGIYVDIYKMIPIYKYLPNGVSIFNPICFSKLIPIYITFILSYLFYHFNLRQLTIITLLCSIFLNIAVFPAVMGGMFLWSILCTSSRERITYIALQAFFTICFWGFYGLTQGNNSIPISSFIITKSTFSQFILFIKNFTIYFSQYILVYLPWLILIFVQKRHLYISESLKNYFLLLFGFIVIGTLSWILLFLHFDAKQFFTIPLTVSAHIILSIIILKIYSKSYKIMIWVGFGILPIIYNNINYKRETISNTNQYSNDFISAVKDEINLIQETSIKGGVLITKESNLLASDMFITGSFLYYVNSNISLTNLSSIDLFKEIDENKTYYTPPGSHSLLLTPIYNFSKETDLHGIQSKLAFVKKFNLRILVFSKNYNIEKEWDALSKKTITDSVSGEIIMFLK